MDHVALGVHCIEVIVDLCRLARRKAGLLLVRCRLRHRALSSSVCKVSLSLPAGPLHTLALKQPDLTREPTCEHIVKHHEDNVERKEADCLNRFELLSDNLCRELRLCLPREEHHRGRTS